MSWQSPNGKGRYYTRSRRVNGKVVREYIGKGELAHAMSALQDARNEFRKSKRAALLSAQQELDELETTMNDYFDRVDTIMKNTLACAGYHRQSRGPWRKQRTQPTSLSPGQSQPSP